MIAMTVRELKTNKLISTGLVDDNWWNVYLDSARFSGRKVEYHGDNSFSITYSEKNKIYTFSRDNK